MTNSESPLTNSVHAGYDPREHFGSVIPPLYPSVAFEFGDFDRSLRLANGEEAGFTYGRSGNPTVHTLEGRVSALSGGGQVTAFASGMAAVSGALLNILRPGDRVISSTELYGHSFDLLDRALPEFGIETDFVSNINDPEALAAAVTPRTRAVFAETVSNPFTTLLDTATVARVAHEHRIPLIVDNTIPTPFLYDPAQLGADIVVYSSTKGINGHGNAIGGLVVDAGSFDWSGGLFPQFTEPTPFLADHATGQARSFVELFGADAYHQRLRKWQLQLFGGILGPFEAYLTVLGLETLPQRLTQQVASATRVAAWLAKQPNVVRVHYSGLDESSRENFPRGVGGVLSFELAGDESSVRGFFSGLQLFSLSANIGDARSLAVQPLRITHRDRHPSFEITPTLVRLSIGLEDPDDLIADLARGLDAAFE